MLKHFSNGLAILIDNHNIFLDKINTNHTMAEQTLTNELFDRYIPLSASGLPGWDIAQTMTYSDEHSGDFHAYVPLSGDKMLILVGHTSSGGLKSALFLNSLYAMLKCETSIARSPAELLNRLSTHITSEKSFDIFASLVALELRRNDPTVKLAIAGHNVPLVNRSRSGYAEFPQTTTGVPLGLFNRGIEPYQDHTIHLLPGDGILIYTDGIIDQINQNDGIAANEKLKNLMDSIPEQTAEMMLSALYRQLISDGLKKSPSEDYTLIYAKTE